MIIPTGDHLLAVHMRIRETYPRSVPAGRIDPAKIRSIMETPFMEVFGHKKYDTIYRQAACLMEEIVRLHPFPDGNKRTALLVTYLFLRTNGIRMAVPLDAVRFTVGVARDLSSTGEEMDRLVDRMAAWIEDRCATTQKDAGAKASRYVTRPARKMLLLALTGIGCMHARRQVRGWLAMDTHPDGAIGMRDTVRLLFRLALDSRRAGYSR